MKILRTKNPRDEFGYTPLHIAAYLGYFEEFKLIFDTVEDKNPRANNALTPLHRAVCNGNFEICKLIIDNVQDVHPKYDAGFGLFENTCTALYLAIRRGQHQIADYIKSALLKREQ